MTGLSSFSPRLVAAILLAAAPAVPSAVHARQIECAANPKAGTRVIEGRVLDIETALPLQRAEVTARWTDRDDQSFKREVLTDRTGEFRICDAPSVHAVTVSAKWFGEQSEPQEIPADAVPAPVRFEIASPLVELDGRVHDAESGSPLAGVAVRIGNAIERLSDEGGAFRFDGIPPGIHDLAADRIGFVPVRDSVAVDPGTMVSLNIRLSTQAVPLQPIDVTVRSKVLDRVGFYEREERGIGTFVARDEMERRRSVNSSDILRRVPGVRLARDAFNNPVAIGRGNCPFRFVIDGTRISQGFSIDELPPDWLEGIEIYSGPSQVPFQFAAGPAEPNARCGVIVLWTRRR